MSHRIIALLVVIVLFGGLIGAYYYFFILNKGDLNIYANIDNYSLSLYNHTLKTTQETFCERATCELIDLAPFDYTLTATKDGYKDISTAVTVLSRDLVEVTITFEKQLMVEAVESTPELVLNREATERQKEEEKIRQDAYASFDIDGKIWYFTQNEDSTLTLSQRWMEQDTPYMTFQHIARGSISLDKIYQTETEVYIRHGDDLYFFDTFRGSAQKVFFPQPVIYVKKSEHGVYHIVTEKGTFLYDSISGGDPQFFFLFRDFIPYEDGYLGVIFSDENDKKNLYQIDRGGHLVVRYTPATKDMKILEKVSLGIQKIVQEGEKIFFYTQDGAQYEVKNIE